MKRIFASALSGLTSFVLLGALMLFFRTAAVAQTQTSPMLPDLNFCLQNPIGDGCVSIPIGYAEAYLQPAGTGNGNMTAQMRFFDTGNTLTATGMANGMDPTKVYVSLFYDTGSVPTGANACLPTNNSLTFPAQMVVGVWLPLGSKSRTLHAVKAGMTGQITDYAPLNAIGTVSIREDTQVGQPIPTRPDPVRFQLRSCSNVNQTALFAANPTN
ncbi:MAG TPA: hypothetical protein VEZ40_09095 [Pyrinomonadaceae bacterium]|nr:hypothetical protein [Pyrinomonadaceae bacterium]